MTVTKLKQATVKSRITRPKAVRAPAPVQSEELSVVQAERLAELETIVERGQQTFLEVGNALREIQERKLYRGTHATFAEYLKEKWSISKAHAYRQIKAAKTVEASPVGDTIQNEHQARQVAKASKAPAPVIEIVDGEIVEEVEGEIVDEIDPALFKGMPHKSEVPRGTPMGLVLGRPQSAPVTPFDAWRRELERFGRATMDLTSNGGELSEADRKKVVRYMKALCDDLTKRLR